MELHQVAQDLYDAIQRMHALETSIVTYSTGRAEKEAKYDIALAREIATLLDSGKPATVSEKIAKGNISPIKQEHNNAEYMFEGIKLKERALQAEISGLQSILSRQSEV